MNRANRLISTITVMLLLALQIIYVSCKNDDPGVVDDKDFSDIFVEEPAFISTDIDLFWNVFDSDNFSTSNFQNEYVNKGTAGLKDYASDKNLAPTLNSKLSNQAYVDYYNAVRNNTSDLSAAITTSEVAFEKLKGIYPDIKFLNVHFLVGALTSGGRVSANGLLIAVEMFSADEMIDLSNLNDWEQNVIRDKEYLPSIVVHELMHVQQFNFSNNRTVLESCMAEGMADFLSHQLMPEEPFMNEHLHIYGNPKEEEIWREFEAEMDLNQSATDWLYTGSSTSNGHPADMGYYIGYKIYESFSAKFASTEDAIEAILTTSYADVFAQSGYADKFN